jgi:hypothetical protein
MMKQVLADPKILLSPRNPLCPLGPLRPLSLFADSNERAQDSDPGGGAKSRDCGDPAQFAAPARLRRKIMKPQES